MLLLNSLTYLGFRKSQPYRDRLIKKGTNSYTTRKRIEANTACAKGIPSIEYTPAIEASCTPKPPGIIDMLPTETPMPKPDNNIPSVIVRPRAPKQNQRATAANAQSPTISTSSRVNLRR